MAGGFAYSFGQIGGSVCLSSEDLNTHTHTHTHTRGDGFCGWCAQVWFAYTRPTDDSVQPDYKMKDVSVSIPQGKSLGLVGHTGCGKSTMIKLILKEYFIEEGEGDLTLAGKDIKDISARWLYSKVAYVPQKPTMFDETIYYNIVYGWDKVCGSTHARIQTVCTHDRQSCFGVCFLDSASSGEGGGGEAESGSSSRA